MKINKLGLPKEMVEAIELEEAFLDKEYEVLKETITVSPCNTITYDYIIKCFYRNICFISLTYDSKRNEVYANKISMEIADLKKALEVA